MVDDDGRNALAFLLIGFVIGVIVGVLLKVWGVW